MIWLIAKVRISRLVQNGMVIRNSSSIRGRGAAGGDEPGGRKADDEGEERGQQRQLHRAPEDRQMRVGQMQRAVEDVAGEQDAAPGVEREPPFDIAVVARQQERIDQHDQQRPGGGDSSRITSAGVDSSQARRGRACGSAAVARSATSVLQHLRPRPGAMRDARPPVPGAGIGAAGAGSAGAPPVRCRRPGAAWHMAVGAEIDRSARPSPASAPGCPAATMRRCSGRTASVTVPVPAPAARSAIGDRRRPARAMPPCDVGRSRKLVSPMKSATKRFTGGRRSRAARRPAGAARRSSPRCGRTWSALLPGHG